MVLSLLARVFETERHRPRAGQVGLSVPLLAEVAIGDDGPLLVTNMQGEFVLTRRSRVSGYARFAFCFCSLETEGAVLEALHRAVARTYGTTNMTDGLAALPGALVVCSVRPEVPEERWVKAELPPGGALLVERKSAGVHTRIGDYVGVLATKVGSAIVAVSA